MTLFDALCSVLICIIIQVVFWYRSKSRGIQTPSRESGEWERARAKHCLRRMSLYSKQASGDGPLWWIRMLFSYLTLILHRNLMVGRLSEAERDRILTSEQELTDTVPRAKLQSLLDHVKFAKWSYPHYLKEGLKGTLEKEGYLLLQHNTVSAPGRPAHYAAKSPATKVLLVVVRGSFGLSDAVTNVMGTVVSQKLNHPRDPRLYQISSHEGFLTGANNVAQEVAPLVQEHVAQGYKVHIVGHSLGASVACVLGTILHCQFPALYKPSRLHVWAYAPAPCLNKVASRAMEPFLTTMVWNEDIVPTMSLANFAFACQMVANMQKREHGHHGSFHIARAFFSAIMATMGFQTNTLSEERQASIFEQAIESAKELLRQREDQNVDDQQVPGKITYLWERQRNNKETGEITGVTARGNELLHLAVFIPSRKGLTDHLLGPYKYGLKKMLEQLEKEESKNEHARPTTGSLTASPRKSPSSGSPNIGSPNTTSSPPTAFLTTSTPYPSSSRPTRASLEGHDAIGALPNRTEATPNYYYKRTNALRGSSLNVLSTTMGRISRRIFIRSLGRRNNNFIKHSRSEVTFSSRRRRRSSSQYLSSLSASFYY